jgi:predicted small integral membrane protein
MLRIAKTFLIFSVAMWGFLGAFGNLAHWEGTTGAVAAVTTMSTFEMEAVEWRAIDSTLLVWMGALFIMLSKVCAAVMCTVGGLRMWRARDDNAAAFNASKEFALVGCAIAMFMLFGGFVVIAETWFELWRSDVMRGPVLGSAFRYGGMITLIALFVASKDD